MLHSAWETAGAAGYLMLFMDTPDGDDLDQRAVTALLDRQVDGIMVVAPELVEYPIHDVLGPVQKILINCADPQHAVTSIVPDEFAGAACAAQILIDRGHTRIVLLTDAGSTIQVRDRSAGVHQALSDAGLAAPRVYTAGVTMRAGLRSGASGAAGGSASDGDRLHPRAAGSRCPAGRPGPVARGAGGCVVDQPGRRGETDV